VRRLCLFLAVLCACAAMRSTDPLNWSELQSEHFQLRTDLTPEDARQAIADLELLRAALLAAGWHSSLAGQGRTLVVELASGAELREFAHKGIEGFVATDAFHQPIMVVSADRDLDDQQVLEHELAHVITNAFLVRNPRWVAEGTACYLETLKLDRKRKKLFVGGVNADRIVFLQRYPVLDYSTLMQTGREVEEMTPEAGYAFETGAWLLVHWLVDTRAKRFDAQDRSRRGACAARRSAAALARI
jgi:hypothetical protein